MPKYLVSLPVYGRLDVEVEADSEKDAITAAFAADYDASNLVEWEACRVISEGNVCHASLNRAEAQEIDDDDE